MKRNGSFSVRSIIINRRCADQRFTVRRMFPEFLNQELGTMLPTVNDLLLSLLRPPFIREASAGQVYDGNNIIEITKVKLVLVRIPVGILYRFSARHLMHVTCENDHLVSHLQKQVRKMMP